MNIQKKSKIFCFVSLLLAMVMTVGWIPNISLSAKADSKISLSNPTVLTDTSRDSGQIATWDCIWFGSYPQTEIVSNAEDCGTYGKSFYKETDYVVDEDLYDSLSLTNGWDSNGDITWNGVKYRRIEEAENMKAYPDAASLYNWNSSVSGSSVTYRYFRYEPIKWRVLHVEENRALLLSDIALDSQAFSIGYSCEWSLSTLRSWLNGYSGSENGKEIDYSKNNFINAAFTAEEQSAILETELDSSTSGIYADNYGEATTDKLFLLAADDVCHSDTAVSYGFYKGRFDDDTLETDERRKSLNSTYTKAMGAYTYESGYCSWWTRTRTNQRYFKTAGVTEDGGFPSVVSYNGAREAGCGVRPSFYLDLSSSLWSDAGTVCSDGTVNLCANKHVWVTEKGTASCTKAGTTDYIYCSVCGEVLQESETVTEPLGHVKVIDSVAVPATCTTTGYSEASHCSRCNAILSEREVTPKLDHKEYWEDGKAATMTASGITAECYCINCGEIIEKAVSIPRIYKVSLSYSSAIYDGKIKSPVLKIYDKAGKQLKAYTDYIVSTPYGRKNVGSYTYKVSFMDNYEGNKKLTLTINPKGTTLSKLTALKKSFKVTWKKNSTQTSGYQVQYSTSSSFASGKTKTVSVSGVSTTTKTIKSLKAKTKYYVRIRTYKTVSGEKYYSAWSAKKYVKTK